MPAQNQEQIFHDRVNLGRLVRSIQKMVASDEWQRSTREPGKQVWIKVQGTLHKVRYARKLLRNLELDAIANEPSSSTDQYQNVRDTLDDLETALLETDKRVAPQRVRPEPLLPTLPIPELPTPDVASPSPIVADSGDAESPIICTTEPSTARSAQDLLLSPSDRVSDRRVSRPLDDAASVATAAHTSSRPLAPVSTGAILQNSRAIQEELSEQLAQMATQLRRNALHFSSSLEKDKDVVLEAQEKLERNYDVMTKERIRLRDHHSKSWGTTWITILSIVVVAIGFLLTFFVIRIT